MKNNRLSGFVGIVVVLVLMIVTTTILAFAYHITIRVVMRPLFGRPYDLWSGPKAPLTFAFFMGLSTVFLLVFNRTFTPDLSPVPNVEVKLLYTWVIFYISAIGCVITNIIDLPCVSEANKK